MLSEANGTNTGSTSSSSSLELSGNELVTAIAALEGEGEQGEELTIPEVNLVVTVPVLVVSSDEEPEVPPTLGDEVEHSFVSGEEVDSNFEVKMPSKLVPLPSGTALQGDDPLLFESCKYLGT